MFHFENKFAFITGGTQGIGFATAQQFIAAGGQVIITGRTSESVQQALNRLGPQAYGLASHAGDMADIALLPAFITKHTPTIDLLFLNAGYGKFAPITQAEESHFDELFNMLVKGPFFTVQRILPYMPAGSSIVFNTSFVTRLGTPHFSVYSAAKAAVQSFIKTFAAECIPQGVRVNGVSPGHVATNIFNNTGLTPEQIQDALQGIVPTIPLGRLGTPAEIAQAVLFLASPAASYIHATELSVDAGMAIIPT